MKGQGNAVGSILSIIVMVSLLLISILMVTSHTKSSINLNLDETQLLRMKNVFSLLDRSLQETWKVSTVQAIFKSGDNSLGCGTDDVDESGNEFMNAGYWYEYIDTKESKKSASATAKKFLSNPTQKYNKGSEITGIRICYPNDEEAKNYIKKILSRYLEIEKKFSVSGLFFEFTEGPLISSLEIYDTYIRSDISQKLKVTTESIDAQIQSNLVKTTEIKSKFKQMLYAGRNMILYALAISDSVENNRASNNFKYLSLEEGIENENSYKKRVENQIKSVFSSTIPSDYGISAIYSNKAYLRAADKGEMDFQVEKQGLIYSYDMNITLSEGVYVTSDINCIEPVDEYRKYVIDAVQSKSGFFGSGWDFSISIEGPSFYYAESEIVNFVYSIINKESGWKADADSGTAKGLMQIVPSMHPECTGDLLDPKTNIECGVDYLYKMFDRFKVMGREKENLMKLSAAAYNLGPERLERIIACAGSSDYDKISSERYDCFIKEGVEASNSPQYINNVLICYYSYSGRISGIIMEWPSDSKYITSCAGYRPAFGRQHNGIDIAPVPEENTIVRAAADGTIYQIFNNCEEGDKNCNGGFGNFVSIKHDNGFITLYAHLKKDSIKINPRTGEKWSTGIINGDEIKSGEAIAEMGNTGYSTGTHLHFEVKKNSEFINPCSVIDCSQSTSEKKCESGYLDIFDVPLDMPYEKEGLYFYHDEEKNTFYQRPFSLKLKIKDSLPVLDCVEEMRNYGEPQKFYTWRIPADTICCGGSLWTCNADIPNLGNHILFEGSKIDESKGEPGIVCKTAINNKYPQYDEIGNRIEIALVCRSGMFNLEPV